MEKLDNFISWLTSSWTSADVIALAFTLGGLWATYRQAKKAKNVSEETRENVTRELIRIKMNISSFSLLERIHSAVHAIELAKHALSTPDFTVAIINLELLSENLTVLRNEELSCVTNKRDEIDRAIEYVNGKIEIIGEQISKKIINESPHKISQVIGSIKSMLKVIERDLTKEAFDGR